MTTIQHSRSVSPPLHPPRQPLLRYPSDPVHVAHPSPQSVYVLSADGSSLFLLDPTKPPGNEEPPPYASFTLNVELPPEDVRQDTNHGTVPFPARTPDVRVLSEMGGHSRHRASTMSAIATQSLSLPGDTAGPSRSRPRFHSTVSHSGTSSLRPHRDRTRSASSSPGISHSRIADETTPLLSGSSEGPRDSEVEHAATRGLWASIFCGELEVGEARRGFPAGWKRFWRPVGDRTYWIAWSHLIFLNFPFALVVWPPLVAGTLAGTALLITLPIGVIVWWLTLFICRSAARLEMIMQVRYHSPLAPTITPPSYHPIFHRIKERSPSSSPISDVSETSEIIWEKRFIKCSYAMFSDHYSYSALSYFLLIKPLIVLFSTIFLVALFPVSLVLIAGLPVYLRAAKRWGKWQAEVAVANL